MAMGIENPVHLVFIGVIALLVLGPKRLPELARALGHGIREFREAIGAQGESIQAPAAQPAVSQTPVAQAPLAETPVSQTPIAHTPSAPSSERAPFTIDSTAEEEPDGAHATVDPAQPIPSGDAPDRRPL